LSEEIVADSFRATSTLYAAMGTVAESVAVFHETDGAKRAITLTNTSLEQFRTAHTQLEAALSLVAHMAEFLQKNWDREFDARLRASGFRGSLFILREFKMHLESIRQTVRDVIAVQQVIAEKLDKGTMGKDPFIGSPTRLMCRAIMRFLEFEDSTAQTQLSFFTLEKDS
jgi:hypothetical protein